MCFAFLYLYYIYKLNFFYQIITFLCCFLNGHGASVIYSKIEIGAQAHAHTPIPNLLNLINRCEWRRKKIQSSNDNDGDDDVNKVSMKQGAQIKNKHTQFRQRQLMKKKKKKTHSKLILLENDSDHSQSEWGLRIS